MDKDARLRKLAKWADMDDTKQLERATLEFPHELNHQISELKKLRQILAIQEVS